MPGWDYGSGWSLWWLLPLAILAMMALCAVFMFSRWRRFCMPGTRGCGQGRAGESALDILRRRYARGEVNKEEFESMRNTLEA